MRTARDAADCIQDVYSGPFNILCFVNTITEEKELTRVSCPVEIKKQVTAFIVGFFHATVVCSVNVLHIP